MSTWEIVWRKPKSAHPPRKLKMPKKLSGWTNQGDREHMEANLIQDTWTHYQTFLHHFDLCAPRDLILNIMNSMFALKKKTVVKMNKRAFQKRFLPFLRGNKTPSLKVTFWEVSRGKILLQILMNKSLTNTDRKITSWSYNNIVKYNF